MAYTILATLPGIPAIFYGDEAGLEGYHDPFNRLPYPWGREDNNLIDFYRRIGSIRRDNDIYKEGDFKLIHLDSDTLIFERCDETFSYITFVNNTKLPRRVEFSVPVNALISNGNEQLSFDMPAYTAQIYKAKKDTYIYF